MDAANFQTQHAKTHINSVLSTSKSASDADATAQGGIAGHDALADISIFNILLNQIQDSKTLHSESQPIPETAGIDAEISTEDLGTPEGANGLTDLANTPPLLSETAQMNIAQILGSNDAIAEDIESLDKIIDFDLLSEIETTLALNQSAFNDNITTANQLTTLKAQADDAGLTLAELLQMQSEGGSNSNNKISDILGKLNAISETEGSEALLSTLNLTPAQITELKSIEADTIPTDEQLEAIEAFIINAINLTQPKQNTAQSAAQTTATAQQANGQSPNQLLGNLGNDTLSDGNAGNTGEGEGDFDIALRAQKDQKYAGNPIPDSKTETPTNTPNAANAADAAKAQSTGSSASAILAAFDGLPLGSNGSFLNSASPYSDLIAQQMGLSLTGSGQMAAQGSLTALVTQSQHASQSHPSTQMVAATMTKAGVNGQDTNITMRLDPADLGRIDISMKFSSDKTVKAVVTAEKPETFLMMQRDTQVLERALQDAGLEAEGGLSFELAEDGHFSQDNNERGGGHDNGGKGASGETLDDENIEIINSTMTWMVDPETGHTRYDIWA